MAERVSATPPAVALIDKLTAEYGDIIFLQSGGCCEGSGPLCMPANEFHASTSDVVLGILGSEKKATFYMGDSHFKFAENMHTILDAQPGSSQRLIIDQQHAKLHAHLLMWAVPV